MQSKESIQQRLDELKREYGEWTYDIPLPFDIWTRGNLRLPHTRLRRVVQAVHDLAGKPLAECRILDLGCLDGIFSIEFALHGASTIGVEIREANIKKAIFCKEALGLDNLEFRQDDVRNITLDSYGRFDAIVCSGILYHLPAIDAIRLVKDMYDVVNRVVVIDTHVSLLPEECTLHEGAEYWGDTYREYADDAAPEVIAKSLWASADNPTSFWFTRPSLINILSTVGFSSVYECFYPVHIIPARENFEDAGITSHDRCTLVAIKEDVCEIKTSPSANASGQTWPEGSLSYAPEVKNSGGTIPLYKKVLSKFNR